MKIAILASGLGSNTQKILEAWKAGRFLNSEIAGVICNNSSAKVLEIAKNFGVKTIVPNCIFNGAKFTEECIEEYLKALQILEADFIVLAGFMKIVPDKIINEYNSKIINLHPSLLPAFKGKDAIRQAWDYGVKFTGCTVHWVSKDLDGGKIIAQKVVEILPEDTFENLEEKIHFAEHELLPAVIEKICKTPLGK